jgi:hypothetical protein
VVWWLRATAVGEVAAEDAREPQPARLGGGPAVDLRRVHRRYSRGRWPGRLPTTFWATPGRSWTIPGKPPRSLSATGSGVRPVSGRLRGVTGTSPPVWRRWRWPRPLSGAATPSSCGCRCRHPRRSLPRWRPWRRLRRGHGWPQRRSGTPPESRAAHHAVSRSRCTFGRGRAARRRLAR